MTSNERKNLECIWNHGGKAHVQYIAHRTKFSSGYSLFLCRSLEKAGHLEFINPNVCKLVEKGYGHFQDHTGIEVVVASSTPQEESTDNPALSNTISDDKNDEFQEDGNIVEAYKNQEVRPDPAVQQVDYDVGEKREDDINKKIEELSSNKDEEKIDSISSADDGDAASEIGENATGNDIKHDEEEIEKPNASPPDKLWLMIKRFVGFKDLIKPLASGHAAQGTTRHQ